MITFSVAQSIPSEADCLEARTLINNYFKTDKDPTQAQVTKENGDWILAHFPDCLNIIKDEQKVIGDTLVLPTTKELEHQFIEGKINEQELFEKIKESVTYDNFTSIYLCSALVREEYQRQNIATMGLVMSMKKLCAKCNVQPTLFYWQYSQTGGIVAQKVAKYLNLELKKKLSE